MGKMTVKDTAHNRLTYISNTVLMKLLLILFFMSFGAVCLQCFDAVGWAAGRASGL